MARASHPSNRKALRHPRIVLAITMKPSMAFGDRFVHIYGRLDFEGGANLVYRDKAEGGHLYGLTFAAQSDRTNLAADKASTATVMYGNELRWEANDTRGMILKECQAGALAIGEINKCMAKIADQAGPCASFGAWVRRLAAAIGTDQVKFPDKEWTITPGQAEYKIDQQIREWIAQARREAGLDQDIA